MDTPPQSPTGSGGPSLARPVSSSDAPGAIGPYSQAVRSGDWLFLSGQLGLDPGTGVMAAPDAAGQACQALRNLNAVLRAAGGSPRCVVKTTIFLADLDDFTAVNAVYAEFFGDWHPARATVQVARLPIDARVEIEAIARIPADN